MKPEIHCLYLIMISLFLSSCQQDLNYENSEFKNGLLVSRANQHPVSGDWVEVKNGIVLSVGRFEEGQHEGLFESYRPDGSLADSVFYMNGKKHGIEVHYDSSGVRRMEIPYLFGEEDGIVREYSEYGNLKQETPFKLGVKSGLAIGYYWTGQVKDSVRYYKNLMGGPYVKYFYEDEGDSFSVQEEGQFQAGKKSGVWRTNFWGRKDYIERNYDETWMCRGLPIPEISGKVYDYSFEERRYYDDGSLKRIERGCYSEGELCGDNQINYYFEDDFSYDRAYFHGLYVDGMKHDRWEMEYYNQDGKEVSEEIYHGGRTEAEWNEFYRVGDYEAIGLQGVWNVSVNETYHFGKWDQSPKRTRESYEVVVVKELNEETYTTVFLSKVIPSSSWFNFPSFNPTNSTGVWECKANYCGQLQTNSIALQQSDHLITFNTSIDFSQFEDYCMEREYRDHRVDLEVTMVRVAPKNAKQASEEQNSTNQLKSTASCVVIDADNGFLVTNQHAVKREGRYAVFYDGIEHEVSVIAKDAANDLALLKLKKPLQGLKDLSISTNDGLGSDVYSVGYPLQNEMGLDVKVTEGLISSVSFLGNTNMYQISCPITFGNSGGALLDDIGNLAGITQGGYRPDMETENVNGAVKAHSIITLAQGTPECQLSLGDRSKKIDFNQLDKSVLVLRSY